MLNSPQSDFRTTDRNECLVPSHFKIQTNWHVITGASCSGKTTLIDSLNVKGFQTIPETARQYFERELAKGRKIDEIRHDRKALTCLIGKLQKDLEYGLQTQDFLFLDRALPDTFVFHRIAGLNPNDFLRHCLHHRYASVFMLDRLPYQQDSVRSADDAVADYYDLWIERDYAALGYNVIRVPVMSPVKRVNFVLEELSELGLYS